ncbi:MULTISPECIES: glycosyltransferase [unclassified Lentimonas]|uniref:CgeB family protein n=1 Tax=unclassified Lentimonas TaxID=2630993 RepID=UPI0013211706|nr:MULTISPECIES: glycosyltransferase [unclassified Lentimonas]CAA6693605.1 Unannotated [Lentimonas sp. CC10]CAA6696852.1 Unannotated [Lentimonas sp. CC19]CAA7071184.1 Unannotated [Lentimonas sp. CC11]
MKILYLGADAQGTTSKHRADALRRLGHEVFHLSPRSPLPNWKLIGGLSVRLGFAPFAPLLNFCLKQKMKGKDFDLAWLDTGAEVSPSFHRWLKKRGMKIINYNVDDPFSSRDGNKWNLYRKSVPYHDLTAVVRQENVEEAKATGASKVFRVYRSYDPVAHAPVIPTPEEVQKWSSEVSFIGTWMPERGEFMARLVELGVPLTIRGEWWQKAPEWERFKSAWKGPSILGREYILSLQLSQVTLGLLSKGNRDLHTTRSAEVPYIGGTAFCAERTVEHQTMYAEGEEAEFWSSPEECAEKCFKLLCDEEMRKRMVTAAKVKVEAKGLSNDAVLKDVLNQLKLSKP